MSDPQLGVPTGWRIEIRDYGTMYYDPYYVALVYETRQIKRHWWSKPHLATGWFLAGYDSRYYQQTLNWILDTIAARKALTHEPS